MPQAIGGGVFDGGYLQCIASDRVTDRVEFQLAPKWEAVPSSGF